MEAFSLQPAVERLTAYITLQNLNMTFSNFLCPADMTVILDDKNTIFISNMDHKIFVDFGELFVVFLSLGLRYLHHANLLMHKQLPIVEIRLCRFVGFYVKVITDAPNIWCHPTKFLINT